MHIINLSFGVFVSLWVKCRCGCDSGCLWVNVGGNCTRRIQVSSPRAISRTRTRLEVERRLFQSLFAELESQKTVERSSLFELILGNTQGGRGH